MLSGTGLQRGRTRPRPRCSIASVRWEGNTCNMQSERPGGGGERGRRVRRPRGHTKKKKVSTPSACPTASPWAPTACRTRLQSRDLIADSIETVMGAQWYDGLITIPGCDKNMPGVMIAMGPAQPAGAHDLRRHHQAGSSSRAPRSTWCRRSRATANSSPARSTRNHAPRSSVIPAPAPAPVAAMYTPTPWPAPSRRSACRCPTAPRRRRSTRASRTNVAARARGAPSAEQDVSRATSRRGRLRECHGGGDGARRVDQCRVAPDRPWRAPWM